MKEMAMRWNRIKIVMACLLGLAVLGAWPAAPAWALTDADIADISATPTPGGAQAGAGAAGAGQNNGGKLKPPTLGSMLVRMALALGVVLGLMALALWGARRFLPKSALATRGGAIEIVATRTLGQRRSLLLVRAQGKTMLLGVTPQQINFLSDFDVEGANWAEAAASAAASMTPRSGLAPEGARGGRGREEF